jgi:soluble lytic murein transglycosylase-like protein
MTLPGLTVVILLVPAATNDRLDRVSAGRAESTCAKAHKSLFDADMDAAARDVAPVWYVPVSLIKAVIWRESGFNPRAHSAAGAIGLMQVMPGNARALGFSPEALWQPADNILAGTRLLAVLLKHYRGDVISSLVAYNARPREPLAQLPDNSETPAYVRAVLHAWVAYAACDEHWFRRVD